MRDVTSFALAIVCKATLILGIIVVVASFFGRRSPHRCLFWLRFGILGLLALPITAFFSNGFSVPVVPARAWGQLQEWTLVKQTTNDLMPTVSDVQSEETSSPSLNKAIDAQNADADRVAVTLPMLSRFVRFVADRIELFFVVLYGVVVAILQIRLFYGWRGLKRIQQSSRIVNDADWTSALFHWCQVLHVARAVELRMSSDTVVPMTFGWRRPVILVPSDQMTCCTSSQRDAILMHELIHVSRNDFFWLLLSRMTAALYWFHPIVWLIRRHEEILCERICDECCSQYLDWESYAQSLVEIAGRNVFRSRMEMGMEMARAASLQRRLTDLKASIRSRYRQMNFRQRGTAGVVAVTVFVLIGCGQLTLQWTTLGEKLPQFVSGTIVDRNNRPIAGAKVTFRIMRLDGNACQTDGDVPGPWSQTTGSNGKYAIKTSAPKINSHYAIEFIVVADGFADVTQAHLRGGVLPDKLQLFEARQIRGQLVDPNGNPVQESDVRFQAYNKDMSLRFDSGPVLVDSTGKFSVSIPKEGENAMAIYPTDFAPLIVKISPNATDLGLVRVDRGTVVTGRVVDKNGHGVGGTVVAVRGESEQRIGSWQVSIARAFKTTDDGSFVLPPLRGRYEVSVTDEAGDYSLRKTITGIKPPAVLPQKIDFSGTDELQEIVFSEARTVTIRGKVRWEDGRPLAGVNLHSSCIVTTLEGGANLDTTQSATDGSYSLTVPFPVLSVSIHSSSNFYASNGAFLKIHAAKSKPPSETLTFKNLLTDIDDADFVVQAAK